MTNVFRTPGALIPSTCLSPFGSMNDSFYAFAPTDGGWPGMGQMSHRMASGPAEPFGLSSSIPRQGFGGHHQSFSTQCGGMTGLGGYCSMAGLTNSMSHSPTGGAGGYPPVPPPYCMPSGGPSSCDSPLSSGGGGSSVTPGGGSMSACGMQDISDIWRGSSIASLRKKALEHTVSAVTGMAGFR